MSSMRSKRANRGHSAEDRYASAGRLLDVKLHVLTDPIRQELIGRLIEECEKARTAKDPYSTRRKSDQEAVAGATSLIKAAKTVARYFRQFPKQGDLIVLGTVMALRASGLKISFQSGRQVPSDDDVPNFVPDKENVGRASAVERLASQLARSAIEHNPAGRGPWLHRVSIPGAILPKSLDDARHKKLIDRATVLGFHLVFWLRAFTTEAKTGTRPRPSDGANMPETGAPHYKVAEEFVRCALGDDISEVFDLADRLRKLRNLQYLGW